MALSKSRVFCPACGLMVEPALGIEGEYRTISCSMCDLLLESKPNPDAPQAAPPPQQPGNPSAMLPLVMAAEDTDGVRKNLVKLLGERGIAQQVIAAANGEEFLTRYHQSIASGNAPSLVILDVNMPILNGINAAIGIRAAERAYGTAPCPILFFTGTQCDDTFKRVLQFTAPARYLNKGAEGAPEQFAERLIQVLQRLLNPSAAAAATT